jgi:CRISPR system Cascade subunit CasD
MRQPGFVTYLGRKSCPLGLPLAPNIDEADDAVAALLARHEVGPEHKWRDDFAGPQHGELVIVLDAPNKNALPGDPGYVAPDDQRARRIEIRRDQLRSRKRWQFDLRQELVLGVPRA